MTTIALEEYTREIDGIMGRESYAEAVAHTLHVLHHFPKHLETYRQLGKALLEKGQHGDAADVFQRILSAEPNDFVAHVGLAIIREEDDQLDQALWHMERAFEMAPSNAAVQAEMRRLYNRRDGVEPSRIRLTRGALARQYLQGDLYGPAIAELKGQLAAEPDRMDLQVVLAETLWRDQQRVETQERCMLILEKLPNCLRANALLADMRLAEGREEEAAPYVRRWQELAPYEARELQAVVSGGGWAPAEKAPPVALELPFLEWIPPARAEGEGEAPEWVRELGLALGEPQKGPVPEPTEEVLPDWLRAAAPEPAAPAVPALHDVSQDEALPDWLRAAEASTQGPEEAAAAAAAPAPEEAAPDWLRELGGGGAAGTAAIAEDLPDWLRDIAAPETPAPTIPSPAAGVEPEIPDWLREAAPEAAPAVEAAPVEGAGPAEGEDPMAWLERLAAQQGAPLEELPSVTRAPAAPPPAAAEVAPAAAQPAPAEGEDLDWLSEVAATPVDEELPDWLRATMEVPTAQAEKPAEVVRHEDEVTDWLRDIVPATPETPSAPAQPVETEMPDWLQTAVQASQETPVAAPPEAPEPAEELPDWLQAALGAEEAAGPPAAAAPAPAEEELDEMPGDPEAARLWLGRVMEREGRGPAGEVPVEPASPAQPAAPAGEPAVAPEVGAGPAPGEDPMAWLERLAAQQGAPVEELPSITQPPAAAVPQEELPDWLRTAMETPAVSAAGPVPDLDVPDWLRAAVEPPAPAVPEPAEPAPAPAAAEAALGPGPDEDPMAWLERLAAQQGAPIEELPSVQAAAVPTAPEPAAPAPAAPAAEVTLGPGPGEDPMAWLERLAAQQGAPIEELPSVQAAGVPAAPPEPAATAAAPAREEELPDWLRAVTAPEGPATEEVPDWLRTTPAPPAPAAEDLGEMPEDPEAARLWLERVMEREGRAAPVEPVAAAPAPAAEAGEGPAPGEDPMAWLERLAAQQGAPLEELPSMRGEQAVPSASVSEAAAEEPAVPAQEVPEWLQSALQERPAVPRVEEPPVPPAGVAAAAPNEEDAMAWLERLAARQGAPLEELPSVTAQPAPPPGGVDVPAWLTSAINGTPEAPTETPPPPAEIPVITEDHELQVTALPPAEDVVEGFAEGEDVVAWLEQLAARQGAPAAELPSLGGQLPAAGAEVETPKWVAEQMAAQPETLPPPEELRLEEPKVEAPWTPEVVEELHVAAAEVIATTVPPEAEPAPVDEGPATPTAPVRDWVRAAEIEKPSPPPTSGGGGIEELRAAVKKSAKDYDARLALARALMTSGDTAESLKQYDVLIKASQHLKDVIADLSRELESHPENAKLRRALGDAYNHDGQFQRALELFRSALKELKK